MIFSAIADWADSTEYPVDFMCTELEVSRSGYYSWRGRPVGARELTDIALTEKIRYFHAAGRGNPGVRRIRADLVASGIRIGLKRVWRLMKAADLQGRYPRTWKKPTRAGQSATKVPDLLRRDFRAQTPDQKWCGDITYVKTWKGWAYFATVIDLHSRKLVGWATSDHMRTDLVIEALDMAIRIRKPGPGVIFHSDRGSQYTSGEFASFCSSHRIRQSMGRTGVCYDNSVAESFFATYKKELIHTRPWPTLKQLKAATFDWIETYYNRKRRHSTLNYLTPDEYEKGYRDITELVA